MPTSRKFLDPEIIARMRGLELRARRVVAGFLSGMHRSAYRGYSVEFAEHRQYTPGDDLRHMDWRLFGRQDRLYIKQYEEETNLRCHILLDVSRSMDYGQGSQRKIDYARRLAAHLAWLLVAQQDGAGLVTFDRHIRARLPAATGAAHLSNLLTLLEQSEPSGVTDVKILFHRLAEELGRRSMVVVISDLLAEEEHVVSGLEHIGHAGHELILLHVMHDDEWNFPFLENVMFEGLEEGTRLRVDPQSLRAGYLHALRRFVQRVEATCLKHRGDYVPVNTREPLDGVLCGYLARRAARSAGGRRA